MTPSDTSRDEGHRGRPQFRIVIDEQVIVLQEPRWSGRQLLEQTDHRPPEDYLLYQLGEHNLLEDIELDEIVDLSKSGIERFITFRSDRSFRFVLNGQRQDWGAPKIAEANLRRLAEVGPEYSVWFEPKGGEARELHVGELVDLTGNEVEHFHTERRLLVQVHNEDNGADIKLPAVRRTKLEALLALMYEELKVPKQPDDRLRCETGGEDVFQFANLTLGDYVDAGHCQCLVWLFAGGTGGATCP
jgi:Multiubiquitin